MMGALRKYLIAGVIALAPLLVTVVLIEWLIDLSDQTLSMIPLDYRPDVLLGVPLPGVGIIMALLFIILVGAVTSHFVGGKLMLWLDRLMERIPFIRTVHKATRQLLNAIFSEDSRAFQEVVLLQFPARGRWVLGFVTGEGNLPDPAGGDHFVSVFIPSTPIPSTGWLMFVDASELVHLDMTVEQGMKLVLSGGMLSPPEVVEETKK